LVLLHLSEAPDFPSSSSFDLGYRLQDHCNLLLAVRVDSLLVPSFHLEAFPTLYHPGLAVAVRVCLVVRLASCLLLAGILHAQP
jgi:hypothetical protein